VTISSDQTLHLNEKKVNIHDLQKRLAQQFKDQKTVYLAADASIRWELLAQVMAELSEGKYQIRMVTKPLESGK
jgi:biopolymer transport protein ExbD